MDSQDASIDPIEQGSIRQACRMTPGQKMLAGADLFDLSMEFVRGGIRQQRPEVDEQELRRLVRETLKLGRQSESNSVSYAMILANVGLAESPY